MDDEAGEVILGEEGHAGWKGECGLYGLLCYEKIGNDVANILDASVNIFLGLVFAWAVGIMSTHLAKKGRIKWKVYWLGSLALLLCMIQTYYLYRAANNFSGSHRYFDDDIYRFDCYKSRKGGKIAQDDSLPLIDRNPCFCHEFAQCRDSNTNAYIEPASCPLDGTANCREYIAPNTKRSISRTLSSTYISHKRDCQNGKKASCTKEQPCTPCELDKLLLFGSQASYCSLCSVLNNGDCHFKPGIGPYCFKSPNSNEFEPCRRCCTESLPVFETYTDPNTNETFTFCSMPKPS
mmetsp:Transcript_24574/g.29589  ORF Transcript_24574/g.29589 Transcript_24574/m.29589 type:complete len:293 (-) Transcript_24574:129-1007(-)